MIELKGWPPAALKPGSIVTLTKNTVTRICLYQSTEYLKYQENAKWWMSRRSLPAAEGWQQKGRLDETRVVCG